MGVDYFAGEIAEEYDASSADMFASETLDPAVDFLADLAGDGAALEFGIGTGRVALPLSERGVPVHGIDLSADMIAKLREKPGAERINVTVGDFAHTRAPGTFRLAYLVFNTISNLTTQDEQVECFRNVAKHLEPGGHFVIELGIPQLRRLPPGETIQPFSWSSTHVGLDEYDVAGQGLVSHHFSWANGQWQKNSIPFRYVWPAELDLMARIAGMLLVQRWNDWHRNPFTSESTAHISVWELPASAE